MTNGPPDQRPPVLEVQPGHAPGSAGAPVRPPTPHAGAGSLARALIRTARPRQWSKNVLVLGAPGAAGVLTQFDVVVTTLAAFAVFCLASSGTYFLNDSLDVEVDRRHPTKRFRPVAAGLVPAPAAAVTGVLLLAAGVASGLALAGAPLALVLSTYAVLQPLYSRWLKHIPVVDLAVVSAGFVLRAIAGGVAVDVPISQWFLIVATFGSLFMVAGKRSAEHADLGEGRDGHRTTLGVYTGGFLHYVRVVSSAVAIAAYCLWAFEKADVANVPIWFQLSIIPFVAAILRYELLVEAGRGGAPEEVVLGDRPLQVLGLAWIAVFAVGVHAG
ncbi:MAG: decaprenyl-phosphate phosphoribosyltransferase [Acidimicrobiales bacterium]